MKKTSFPSPKEYLKSRRPESFSDSVVEAHLGLTRTVLEYHLGTITNRSQEADFERFAYELVKQEICPNLIPNTGPTGGGDGKVDTETYPLAEGLALGWHIGSPSAGTERWAFAFSAISKTKVRSKITSDIKKVSKTGRGYTKAFFVSSQSIKASTKSELEDKLSKEHGLQVTILDRAWILDRIFTSHREQFAVDQLRIQVPVAARQVLGPNDVGRQRLLEEHEARISAMLAQPQPPPAVVEEGLAAAVLARGLELPRTEVDGRFVRAIRLAERHGTKHQQLLAHYQYAWTSYFWLEDESSFLSQYEQVESRAKGTENIYELELLNNLWGLLRVSVAKGTTAAAVVSFDERTRLLRGELERHAKNESRPSAALQARTFLLMMDFDPGHAEGFLRELKTVVEEAKHLIGYPIHPLIQFIESIGEFSADDAAYDELVDSVAQAVEERSGDIAAARVLLLQGARLSQANPRQALRTVGKALTKLYKNETKDEMSLALRVCADAYEKAGLTWAARGAMLTATSLATGDLWKHEKVTVQQLQCLSRLKWLELRLGRIPHALAWYRLELTVRAVFLAKGRKESSVEEDDALFDGCMGILLLKADLPRLKAFECLPDALTELGLHMSQMSLAFALGDEDAMREGLTPERAAEFTPEFFALTKIQPANADLPDTPSDTDAATLEMRSRVLGCELILLADNKPPCAEVGESFLAATEALLATALGRGILAHTPTFSIVVRLDPDQAELLMHVVDTNGADPVLRLTCSNFNPQQMSAEDQKKVKSSLSDAVIQALAHAFAISDIESTMKTLLGDERAHERSINFSASFVVVGSLLGEDPPFTMGAWCAERKRYELRRERPWDDGLPPPAPKADAGPKSSSRLPEEFESMSHGDLRVVTVVRKTLWDRAGWGGVAFLVSSDLNELPVMSPIFEDAGAAKEIFVGWRAELGEEDPGERLRISVIRGIDSGAPHSYRVVIGSNREKIGQPAKFLVSLSRIHTMTPSADTNLRMFLDRYERLGKYIFVPCRADRASGKMEIFWDLFLKLKHLHVRHAYEIGPHDEDVIGLAPEDSPIVPADVKDPPVEASLRKLKEKKG